MREASNFLEKCDLNTGRIGIKEVFEFTLQNKKPIPELKERIIECMKSCELYILLIEGGMIE